MAWLFVHWKGCSLQGPCFLNLCNMTNAGPLIDSFARVHDKLRISVTDRCNIRCSYCMPEEAPAFADRSEILSFEEIERFVLLAARLEELDVKAVLRGGGSDDDLVALIRRSVHDKWEGHNINTSRLVQPARPMYAIGG